MRVIGNSQLRSCVAAVAAGEIVALPTRRWYMLCANATDPDACAAIFAAKRRSRDKPLALVLDDNPDSERLFVFSAAARRLAEAFWPGDLALLLPRRDPADRSVCDAVGSPAALVTRDPGAIGELADLAGFPLATAVVSISDPASAHRDPAITVEQVAAFAAAAPSPVTYVVDGGICPAARHFTIVDCTVDPPCLDRTGEVHERAIAAALRG